MRYMIEHMQLNKYFQYSCYKWRHMKNLSKFLQNRAYRPINRSVGSIPLDNKHRKSLL